VALGTIRKRVQFLWQSSKFHEVTHQQVAIGESTCAGRFFTAPAGHGGTALMEVGELSSIALERCDTAR